MKLSLHPHTELGLELEHLALGRGITTAMARLQDLASG